MLARHRTRRAAAGYGQPELTAATASSGTAQPIGQICTLALSCADQHHVDHIGGYFVWWRALMQQAVPVVPAVAGSGSGRFLRDAYSPRARWADKAAAPLAWAGQRVPPF
jgi:hypothetical protein